MHPHFRRLALSLTAAALLAAPAAAQTRKRRPAPTRPSPADRAPAAAPAKLTQPRLAALLKAAGYPPSAHGGYLRLRVDEPGFGYFIDFSISKSGDWLVAMAHLAPIPDLTKVPGTPLLNLLALNDSLLGMSFSYNRSNARLMLNTTVPADTANAGTLRNMVAGIRSTVAQTQDLWDTTHW
jgi:hypothetical protein